jgi:hypothetical protein
MSMLKISIVIKPVVVVGLLVSMFLSGQVAAAPDIEFWRGLRVALVGENGEDYFKSGVKGAHMPGSVTIDGVPVNVFRARITSVERHGMLTGVVDGGVPDVRIDIDGMTSRSVKSGAVCTFAGVATSFRKQPFQLTFRVKPDDLRCK